MSRRLVHRLMAIVDRLPEKECIVAGPRRVTYAQLGNQVLATDSALRSRIAPGDRVALLMDSSAEYVGACYGTWRARGVVVGLNTALKAPALAHLIDHCGATVLITDPGHPELAQLKGLLGDGVEVMEAHAGGMAASKPALPETDANAGGELAAVVYTSGTTGHPKGVMLSHENILANTDSICEYLGIGEDEKALCVLPFFYSYGASVLHTHILSGATLVLESSFMYPHKVLERMVAERVTSFAGVPSTFYLLLRRTDLSAHDLSSLRYVTQAGGRMDSEEIRRFSRRVPDADFVVMYGQTEATARLSYVPPAELGAKLGSAGKAIPGVDLCVRDEQGRELPSGEIGEICARGANVMMGYWADPQETAEVLVDGWLHTGDLGYLDEDGYLFLRGRTREMIKSGAHRISPAEIEEVIRELEDVNDVAVVGIDDEMLGQAIKACVISSSDGDTLRRMIQKRCRDRLPLFKVPKIVEFWDEFPRTASGKTRKHLL